MQVSDFFTALMQLRCYEIVLDGLECELSLSVISCIATERETRTGKVFLHCVSRLWKLCFLLYHEAELVMKETSLQFFRCFFLLKGTCLVYSISRLSSSYKDNRCQECVFQVEAICTLLEIVIFQISLFFRESASFLS